MNIYVGNLSFSATEDDIRAAFEGFGQVDAVHIITDRETGRSKGFGFVEMPSNEEATAAIEALNGKEIKGRTINVNEARPKPQNDRRGGPRRGGGGGSGRGFGPKSGGGRRY